MIFRDLREFIKYLERRGELVRVPCEVSPDQEVTVIQHKVGGKGGPALLFEHVRGSEYPVVTNLFGTIERTRLAFGDAPAEMGEKLFSVSKTLMPPAFSKMLKERSAFISLFNARMKRVKTGPVLEKVIEPPDLNRLPVLTCWPEDGGPFFTLPMVHTTDPLDGRGNLGIYRLQRFSKTETGMHWQIEKGGGFHFNRALKMGKSLPVSVILGGPPSLIIASVAPLPEGIDERLLAAYLSGVPLNVAMRPESGHLIPVNAEFVLEGEVLNEENREEGPFGDHFGHYSCAAPYPVFRVKRLLARKDAIYPATVVGKPIQEDYWIGVALQEFTMPLLRMIKPAIHEVWAYPETGFHPLAVMSVCERYPREALKHVLGMLGEGQLSLTKVMIVVDPSVNVKDFKMVSKALYRNIKADEGLHLLAPTAQDTLDFTGPSMNTGSRLILLGTEGLNGDLREEHAGMIPQREDIDDRIDQMASLGPSFLMVRLKACELSEKDVRLIAEKLCRNAASRDYLFHVLLSSDIDIHDPVKCLWGWFTRFDPLNDLVPSRKEIIGNRLVFDFPILIDARWKKGYPKPVEFDPDVEKFVRHRWKEYCIPVDAE